MTIEESLVAYLSSVSALTALISTRITPFPLPQGSALPALTYARVSNVSHEVMEGAAGCAQTRFQFSAFGAKYSDPRKVVEQVRKALQGFRGTMGGVGGAVVSGANHAGDTDLYEPETRLYQCPIDFIIFYNE